MLGFPKSEPFHFLIYFFFLAGGGGGTISILKLSVVIIDTERLKIKTITFT